MATQVITNHHVTFSGSNTAFPRHVSPGPAASVSSSNGFTFPNGYGHSALSVEHDNPFRPGSELIEEAENILKTVTIVGNHVTVAGNDSGISSTSPQRPNVERSPIVAGSANETREFQCSTIASTTSSTPGQLRVAEDPLIVQRASPELIRPDSPPMRAEHVVVSHGTVKTSPKSPSKEPVAAAEPSNPFKDPKLQAAAAEAIESSHDQPDGKKGKKSKKDKKKKKCSIL